MKLNIMFVLLLIILIACGNEPPLINEPIYNILIYQEGSSSVLKDSIFLSVHFMLDDENGLEDIEEVKIIHIETEYSWTLQRNLLEPPTVWDEKTYTGYSFLEFNNAKSILPGEYIIEVVDSAGNEASASFNVEIQGAEESKPYDIPEIKYTIEEINKNTELKISNDDYSSCEIKILDDMELFNGGRKKFTKDQKIILNNDNPAESNYRISVRVNKDEEEKTVYFLKTFITK